MNLSPRTVLALTLLPFPAAVPVCIVAMRYISAGLSRYLSLVYVFKKNLAKIGHGSRDKKD
jgi:hypothetical protein